MSKSSRSKGAPPPSGGKPTPSGTANPGTGSTSTPPASPSTGPSSAKAPTPKAPTPKPSTSTSSGSRAAARRVGSQPAGAAPRSPLERYRGVIIAGAAIIGIGIVGLIAYQSVTAAPYVCDTLLTPAPSEPVPTPLPTLAPTVAPSVSSAQSAPAPASAGAASAAPASALPVASSSPTPDASSSAAPEPSAQPSSVPSAGPSPAPSAEPSPTPVPQPTARLGFATTDLGRNHLATNSTLHFGFCPPTSGNHWSQSGVAPLRRDLYAPNDRVQPGSWVHNLEHGYVVIAYKGEADAATLAQIRDVMASTPPSAIATQCGMPNKVMAVRFDDMSEPFAVLAWDRALLMKSFDPQQAVTFAEQWQDSPQSPEQLC